LDVIFKENYCRVRTGNGAENLNSIRKITLNTIKRDNTVKTSFKNKRKMCSWNDNFALNILKMMNALNIIVYKYIAPVFLALHSFYSYIALKFFI
jgi:hypothetical protein